MRIIFHYPLPLNPKAMSASGIRPLKMVEAFKSLGYHVDLVTGYSWERKAQIEKIKRNIGNGIKYDFMYCESSTMPTLLTDKHHLPLNPFLDFGFFKYLRKHDVPVALFYRDIYWLFPIYDKQVPFFKAIFAKIFYRYDLYQYQRYLTILYLPSVEMANYIPLKDKSFCKPLPPGHDNYNYKNQEETKASDRSKIKVIYVGGIGPYYQMHKLFEALVDFPNIEFILNTRKEEWEAVSGEYLSPLPSNIFIFHKSGAELASLYSEADIGILFVKPQEYRKFAVPFKLFEYLGYRKPIIASQGTWAGKFVEENNIGWCIPYDVGALKTLFRKITQYPELIKEKKAICEQIAPKHTWIARAQQVVKDLTWG